MIAIIINRNINKHPHKQDPYPSLPPPLYFILILTIYHFGKYSPSNDTVDIKGIQNDIKSLGELLEFENSVSQSEDVYAYHCFIPLFTHFARRIAKPELTAFRALIPLKHRGLIPNHKLAFLELRQVASASWMSVEPLVMQKCLIQLIYMRYCGNA